MAKAFRACCFRTLGLLNIILLHRHRPLPGLLSEYFGNSADILGNDISIGTVGMPVLGRYSLINVIVNLHVLRRFSRADGLIP